MQGTAETLVVKALRERATASWHVRGTRARSAATLSNQVSAFLWDSCPAQCSYADGPVRTTVFAPVSHELEAQGLPLSVPPSSEFMLRASAIPGHSETRAWSPWEDSNGSSESGKVFKLIFE